METELLFAKQTFYYESHQFLVISYENRELSYLKTQSKPALNIIYYHFRIYSISFNTVLASK